MLDKKIKILLLPGMDGTGLLLKTFAGYLEGDVRIIRYTTEQKQSYRALVKYVASQLQAHAQYVVVAESFSGPIAYDLLKTHTNIISVVFVASFITRPHHGLLITKYFPYRFMGTKFPDFVAKFLLGKLASAATVAHFQQAVRRVSSQVLGHRIRQMATLTKPQAKIHIRCSYLRPSHDVLVSNECKQVIKAQCHDFMEYRVEGSHFVLQVNPKAAAEVVNREIRLATGQ